MTLTNGMIELGPLRELAASWHGGMWSPLYALCSSGAIVEGCVREIEDCIAIAEQYDNDPDYAEDIPRLRHLLVYVRNHGFRGPVEGWSEIRF